MKTHPELIAEAIDAKENPAEYLWLFHMKNDPDHPYPIGMARNDSIYELSLMYSDWKQRAEAAEARAAQLEQERDGYKDAYARFADEIIELQAQLSRLTLERDNALAERDRANAGFSALSKEYDKAMTRLAAHGEKVTA